MKSIIQRFLIPAIALLTISGCGLSDYTTRMDAQRQRVKAFDTINDALGDPITNPRMSLKTTDGNREVTAWPFGFFLRLPKGISTTPMKNSPFNYTFPCYGYVGADANFVVLVAAAEVLDDKGEEGIGKYTPAKFRSYLRGAFDDFYFKTYHAKAALRVKSKGARVTKKAVSVYPDNTQTAFDRDVYLDGQGREFDIYIYSSYTKQLCVAFHYPATWSGNEQLNTKIDLCLGSLDTSSHAAGRRERFMQMKASSP